jgi:hypothetical protein
MEFAVAIDYHAGGVGGGVDALSQTTHDNYAVFAKHGAEPAGSAHPI